MPKTLDDKLLTEEMNEIVYSDLFTIDGVLVERYNKALEHITGKRTALKSFRIDKRGKSPEIMEELGVDYLNLGISHRYTIIVSPDQKDAPLIFETTSYDNNVLDMMFTQNTATIHKITQSEAMYAEIDDQVNAIHCVDDLINLNNIRIEMRTAESTLRNMRKLLQMSDELGDDKNILSGEYINTMLDLVSKVGDARKISMPTVVEKQINNLHVELFGGVYLLRNLPNKIRIHNNLFLTRNENFKDQYPNTIIMRMNEPELIDVLYEFGLIDYEPNLIERRQVEMENEHFISKGIVVTEMSEIERKRAFLKYSNGFPESWNEMQEIRRKITAYRNGASYRKKSKLSDYEFELISSMSPATKIKLAVPKTEKALMNHMLSELDPTDLVRLYTYNRHEFMKAFSQEHVGKKDYMLHTVKGIVGEQAKMERGY
jgi:hypothetical protein